LARRLYFQFADGPYHLKSGLRRLLDAKSGTALSVQRSLVHHTDELHALRAGADRESKRLGILYKALRSRTTSVGSDEPICLSNIMGYDARAVLGIPSSDDDRRMLSFWRMASEVPIRFAFILGEHLSYQGFRWAPRTLLRQPWEPALSHTFWIYRLLCVLTAA
jgi:hypothetical protein